MKGAFVPYFFCGLLYSCVTVHSAHTHSVPDFRHKNQFEGGASVGISSANVNVAYTPIKYISVFGNGQTYLWKTPEHYQRSLEAGIGAYLPKRKFVAGLNVLGGTGDFAFVGFYRQRDAYKYYTYLSQANGFFNKLSFQIYIGFRQYEERPSAFYGVSIKDSFYETTLTTVVYKGYEARVEHPARSYTRTTEVCLFYKDYFSKHFFFDSQLGVILAPAFYNSISEVFIFRSGLGLMF